MEITKAHKLYELESCLKLKAEYLEKAEFIAGGTDLLVHIREKENHGEVILDISDIKELKGINYEEETVTLGAMTTFTEICESDWAKDALQGLWEACKSVGSPQIRNTGTLGGNVANGSPAADSAPPLLALGSQVTLKNQTASRVVDLDAFYLGKGKTDIKADEVLTQITFNKPTGKYALSFEKLGLRNALAISRISASIYMECDDAGILKNVRVASGSIGLVPQRETKMETYLTGKNIKDKWQEEALTVFSDIVKERLAGRSSMPFKKEAIKGVFEKALTKALDQLV